MDKPTTPNPNKSETKKSSDTSSNQSKQQSQPTPSSTPKSDATSTLPAAGTTPSNTPQYLLLAVGILLVMLTGYLILKVNKLEARVMATEVKVATGNIAPVEPTQAPIDINKLKKLFTKEYMSFGNPNSKLVFVEFSDPSCPFCHIAAGKNKTLATDRFKLVEDGGTYVSPVTEMRKLVDAGQAAFAIVYANGHGNGELATQALYCAYDAGPETFWQTHDLLMSDAGYTMINDTVKNDVANAPLLAEFLAGVADQSTMLDCLQTGKYANRIQRDLAHAAELGIQGTPGFIVNTTRFPGAYSFTDMQAAIDAAQK